MVNIKTKDTFCNKSIKTLNRTITVLEKSKSNLNDIKDKTNLYTSNEQNEMEYGYDRINQTTNYTIDKVSNHLIRSTNKSKENAKNNFIKIKNNTQLLNSRNKSKKLINKGKTTVKTAKEVAKKTVKTTQNAIKQSQKVINITKQAAKTTIQVLKISIKASVASIKAIIAGTKALVTFLCAGGWIAVVIILVICMVGALCNSIFGIFLSNESVDKNTITMKSVIQDINIDVSNKIEQIKTQNQYDDYEVISYQSEWKKVLAIYVAQVSKGKNEIDVMTLSIEKVNLLKKIFWEMNEITSSVEEKTSDMLEQNSKKKILTITIKGKSISEMETKYMFNQSQKLQVDELLKKEYDSLWNSILYGSTIGNLNMSQIAANEIGNKGGKKYWSWYGFESRIEWCAVFVSWVANQMGYIDSGIIPKFTTCHTQGVPWFKNRGQWQEKGYIPKSGDIIFLDWQQDGYADHVGIVEYVENNEIYTIEGNLDDEVKNNKYSINSKDIYGYGILVY